VSGQSSEWDPQAVWARLWCSFHMGWFRATGGQVLSQVLGMPVVMLTTTGRRSGARRDVMLTSPCRDGERLVVVASNGGRPTEPAWLLNVRADPDVDVTAGGVTRAMRAREATADEREGLWPLIDDVYAGYARYQARTERRLPLVILEPVDG
jgi:deazaflavin-dependent oxidoreductase (nitroreductase family)